MEVERDDGHTSLSIGKPKPFSVSIAALIDDHVQM